MGSLVENITAGAALVDFGSACCAMQGAHYQPGSLKAGSGPIFADRPDGVVTVGPYEEENYIEPHLVMDTDDEGLGFYGPPDIRYLRNGTDPKYLPVDISLTAPHLVPHTEGVDLRSKHFEEYVTLPNGKRVRVTITDADKDAWFAALEIDYKTSQWIRGLAQRTPAWHRVRKGRATGSRLHKMKNAGDKYSKKSQPGLAEDIWGTFKGNPATEYGTRMEPHCEQVTYTHLLYDIRSGGRGSAEARPDAVLNFYDFGLQIPFKEADPGWGWVGVSTDGEVHIQYSAPEGSPDDAPIIEVKTLEMKCPFGMKYYQTIPPQYWDQIQGAMGFPKWRDGAQKADECYFSVYTPEGTRIQVFDFDPGYFFNDLRPKLAFSYANIYVPACIWKARGVLEEGKIRYRPSTALPALDFDDLDAVHVPGLSSSDDSYYSSDEDGNGKGSGSGNGRGSKRPADFETAEMPPAKRARVATTTQETE